MPPGGKGPNRNYENKIYFEAETVNPNQGKITWREIVHGDSIEVNYRWSKKGWLSDTEKKLSIGADDLIQLHGRKVITGKNITT